MSVATDERKDEALKETACVEIGRRNRAELLDLLRGFAIIYVMLYHLLYDLIFFGGRDMPFFYFLFNFFYFFRCFLLFFSACREYAQASRKMCLNVVQRCFLWAKVSPSEQQYLCLRMLLFSVCCPVSEQ